MGGVFREYDKLEKDRTAFKIRAKQASKKQSETIYSEYRRLLKKKCRANWTFGATIIAAAISTFGVIIALVEPHLMQTDTNARVSSISSNDALRGVTRCNIPNK